ncbi:MAG: LysE family translocator, partial [Pseudomonadota bacterium]|nr:LysE family translocator [Pseudomonadota bacterium]
LASVGHGLGVFGYALAAATGLSYLLHHYQTAFLVLQLMGAGLLFWLGVRILLAIVRPVDTAPEAAQAAAFQNAFRDGFLIAVFNPKIAAFFISLFSQFLGDGQPFALHLTMAGLAGFIDMAVYVFYAVLASTAVVDGLMKRYARFRDGLFAVILIGLSVSLFISHLNLV